MIAAYVEFGGSGIKHDVKRGLILTVQQKAFQSICQDENVSGVCTYPLVFQLISPLRFNQHRPHIKHNMDTRVDNNTRLMKTRAHVNEYPLLL